MPLFLYDTLARCKREFQPLDERCVKVYVCGPTVYAEPHIGNARPAVIFDVLVRLLRLTYGASKVKYVRNITDVEDKILAAALESGTTPETIAQKYADIYHEDMKALGVLPPDIEPKVTDNMDAIRSMIKRLVDEGHAYEGEGHVLFDVTSHGGYGTLSKRDREAMIAGARVETAPYKRDPADFVLWKPSSLEQVGWDSAWGRGRPGWHIECSAMIKEHLGDTIDIHGGGIDLIFPHHENECAQSFCVHQKPLANYWVHNSFVNMGKDKMSKSEGNILTVRDLLLLAPGESIRYALLNRHYRKPLDWKNWMIMGRSDLTILYCAVSAARGRGAPADVDVSLADERVVEALEDNLNTPLALKRLFLLAGEIDAAKNKSERRRLGDALVASGYLLGILQLSPQEWIELDIRASDRSSGFDDEDVKTLLEVRAMIREQGNFAMADKIREILVRKDIIVEDTPKGPTWRRQGWFDG